MGRLLPQGAKRQRPFCSVTCQIDQGSRQLEGPWLHGLLRFRCVMPGPQPHAFIVCFPWGQGVSTLRTSHVEWKSAGGVDGPLPLWASDPSVRSLYMRQRRHWTAGDSLPTRSRHETEYSHPRNAMRWHDVCSSSAGLRSPQRPGYASNHCRQWFSAAEFKRKSATAPPGWAGFCCPLDGIATTCARIALKLMPDERLGLLFAPETKDDKLFFERNG